jgi:hypothetical protein
VAAITEKKKVIPDRSNAERNVEINKANMTSQKRRSLGAVLLAETAEVSELLISLITSFSFEASPGRGVVSIVEDMRRREKD